MRCRVSGSFDLIPTSTPNDRKEKPATHPRRSTLAISGSGSLSEGNEDSEVSIIGGVYFTCSMEKLSRLMEPKIGHGAVGHPSLLTETVTAFVAAPVVKSILNGRQALVPLSSGADCASSGPFSPASVTDKSGRAPVTTSRERAAKWIRYRVDGFTITSWESKDGEGPSPRKSMRRLLAPLCGSFGSIDKPTLRVSVIRHPNPDSVVLSDASKPPS